MSFEQIRTDTVVQSSDALQDKSTINLERLAAERATAVDQILGSAEQIAIATSYYLANAPLRETEVPLPPDNWCYNGGSASKCSA